jgi:hypothetical protein
MLQITKNKDEIVVREISVAQWLYSLIIAVILFFSVFIGLEKLTHSLTLAGILGTSVSFTGILLYLMANPSTTIKINKQGQTISIRKRSPIKSIFKIYSFNEISDLIYVGEFKDSGFQTNYQIIMPLKNGQNLELSNPMRMNSAEYIDAADSINSYIFGSSKQISAKIIAWNLNNSDD